MPKLSPVYGKPTNSDTKFETDPIEISRTTPQAWFHKGNWFYNYPGALLETKSRGERLPTKDELLVVINSLPGNCVEKARALNLPFAGSRDSDHGEFGNEEDFSCLWSSSSVGDDMARYVYLQRVLSNAFDGWNDRGHGFLVCSFR